MSGLASVSNSHLTMSNTVVPELLCFVVELCKGSSLADIKVGIGPNVL